MSHQGETCKDPVKLCKCCPTYIAHKSPSPCRGGALLRPPPSLPLRGKVAPQGRMRGNLADNALYRAIFPSPPACREGACPLRRFPLNVIPHLPPCRGRACPARNLPDTTACIHRAANPQHTPCPKIPLKICRKNQKQPLTIVIHIAIISKLFRGGHAAKSAS